MRIIRFAVLVLVAALLVPTTAHAGPPASTGFVVDDAGDDPIDSPTGCAVLGDADSGGTCTLREAIWEANNNGNAAEIDEITFDLPPGTTIFLVQPYPAGGFGEPNLPGGDLDVTESVVIDGPGITVDASLINNLDTNGFNSSFGNQDRVFDIADPTGSTALDVTLRGLTITGGFTQPGQHGGGVRAIDCGGGTTVLLDDVVVNGNMADPPWYSSAYSRGGGVYGERAALNIIDSTISGNLAQQGGGVAYAEDGYSCSSFGGADSSNRADTRGAAAPDQDLHLTSTTVTGNAMARNVHGGTPTYAQNPPDDGFGSQGAGIWTTGITTLDGVILSDNGGPLATEITGPDGSTTFPGEAPWEGGGIYIGPGPQNTKATLRAIPELRLPGSIVDGNRALYAGGGLYANDAALGFDEFGVVDSAIINNVAGPGDSAFPANGGGGMALVNVLGAAVNTVLAGNAADDGAAILNLRTSSASPGLSRFEAAYVTVADNVPATATEFAQTPPGASVQVDSEVEEENAAEISLFNSILQSSSSGAPTCLQASGFASITSLGGNSDDDDTCGLDQTGDVTGVTQALGPLAANDTTRLAGDDPAQPVPSMALLDGAEAIDAASDEPDFPDSTPMFAGLTTFLVCGGTGPFDVSVDQRGVARPQDGDNDGTAACDRGAFELVYQPPPPPPTSTPTVDVGVTKTGPTEVVVGDPVQYTIEVTNSRNRADGVVVSDTVPSGLTLDGASAPCTTSGSSISCDLGSLTAGETATVTVDATAASEGTFTNTACASTTDRDTNAANNCDSHTVTITGEDTTERVEGPERITTAVAGSQVVFDDGTAQAVVLTRADDFPDAQAGTPLAIARDAAMLLSQPEQLSAASEEEILRVLAPGGTVYLLGGTAALSQAVEDRVAELGYAPVRLAGPNRFGTAVAIAQELGDPGTLLMANGHDFPASVVAGAAAVVAGDSDFSSFGQAGQVGAAVVLTAFDTVPPETQAYLDGLATAPELIPVGDSAAAAFPDEDDAIVGENLYDLSVKVAERFFPTPRVIGVATGANFADALVGGSLVGRPAIGPGPMLLTSVDDLPDGVADYVGANVDTISRLFIFGGSAAVMPAVEDELNAILGIEPE